MPFDLNAIPFGIALIVTFLVGIVAFVSPCVLPLIPAYISYMGGRVTNKVAAQVEINSTAAVPLSLSTRFSTFTHGVAFVAGFTFIFVSVGLVAAAFVGLVGGSVDVVKEILARVGGIVIIFFGLHFMGVMPSLFARLRKENSLLDHVLTTFIFGALGSAVILWGFVEPLIALPVLTVFLLWLVLAGAITSPGVFWRRVIATIEVALYADTRRQMTATGQQGFLGSAFLGMVFAAGWTPCIGPVYGAALNLALTGTSANIAVSGILLTAFSLGLGIPFLITTILLDSAQVFLRRLQRHMRKIELVSGVLLILIGFFVMTGQLGYLVQSMQSATLGSLSSQLEYNIIGAFTGENIPTPMPTATPIPSSSLAPSLNHDAPIVFNASVGHPHFTTISDAAHNKPLTIRWDTTSFRHVTACRGRQAHTLVNQALV